jgi:hypothetical protein
MTVEDPVNPLVVGSPGAGGIFIRCTFTSQGVAYNLVSGVMGPTTTWTPLPVTFIDCLFDNSTCTGGTVAYAINIGGAWRFINCSHTGSGVKIDPLCDYAGVHFSTFTQGIANDYGLEVYGAGSVYLVNPTFGANSGGSIKKTRATKLYLNNGTPGGFSLEKENTFVKDNAVIGLDSHSYDIGGSVESSTVVRDVGEKFSVKLIYDRDALVKKPICLGRPGFETIMCRTVAGSNTITIYGAHKSYGGDPPTADDLWIEVEYYANSGDCIRAIESSKAVAALTADSSTWTGDTGLTTFKIEVTITAGRFGIVPVRVYMNKYHASAFVYLDPQAEVV